MASTRTVTVPVSTSDHVAALRVEALYTTNRIVAMGGTPRSLALRRIAPVVGFASVSLLSWVLNGAFFSRSSAVIMKPYLPSELVRRIRELIDRARGDEASLESNTGLIDDPRR